MSLHLIRKFTRKILIGQIFHLHPRKQTDASELWQNELCDDEDVDSEKQHLMAIVWWIISSQTVGLNSMINFQQLPDWKWKAFHRHWNSTSSLWRFCKILLLGKMELYCRSKMENKSWIKVFVNVRWWIAWLKCCNVSLAELKNVSQLNPPLKASAHGAPLTISALNKLCLLSS